MAHIHFSTFGCAAAAAAENPGRRRQPNFTQRAG